MQEEREFKGLEEALARAGRTIAYPPTPPLAARVRAELDAPKARSLSRFGMGWGLVATLAVAAGIFIMLPVVPRTLAGFWGSHDTNQASLTPAPSGTPTLAYASSPTKIGQAINGVSPTVAPVPTTVRFSYLPRPSSEPSPDASAGAPYPPARENSRDATAHRPRASRRGAPP